MAEGQRVMTYAEELRAEYAKLDDAQVGDGVRWIIYSDVEPGYVKSRTEKTMIVERAGAELLNGFNSGEEDALKFAPGGFAGHTSGEQRYRFYHIEGASTLKFTRRSNGDWKLAGHPTRSPGMKLYLGIGKHYDYNF